MVVQVADWTGRRSAAGRSFLIARHYDQRSEGCFAQRSAANKESIDCSRCRTCCLEVAEPESSRPGSPMNKRLYPKSTTYRLRYLSSDDSSAVGDEVRLKD